MAHLVSTLSPAFALLSRSILSNVPTHIFGSTSTPAAQVRDLSIFILIITAGIFVAVTALLVYALYRFRCRQGDTSEPAQVFGSVQIELAWTIIPLLLIVVLFLGTARILFAIQDAPKPASALDVVVIGHQFWWEFRYPKYGVVTANELHVPRSDRKDPTPTFLKITSADVMHSFWVPKLAGKTDVLPNRVNEMWVDPHVAGMYEGQCAQFCGTQHAKMLLRVYVDPPEQFQAWIANQQKMQESGVANPQKASLEEVNPQVPNAGKGTVLPAESKLRLPVYTGVASPTPEMADAISPEAGRRVFEQQACMNCHTISGTAANGRFGPDLTHLMSRDTIASGAANNTPDDLRRWITDPNDFKPGSLMPAMHLSDRQNAQITAYLLTLK